MAARPCRSAKRETPTDTATHPQARADAGDDAARRFAAWLQSKAGRRLLAAERALLQDAVRRFHGDAVLWVGPVRDLVDTTARCMVRERLFAGQRSAARRERSGTGSCDFMALAADAAQLPLPAACADGVVLHHALDVCADGRGALREAARVLRPGGRLLVLGINPLSLWLLAKPAGAFRRMKPVSAPRLADWLALLGLERTGKTAYRNYRSVLPSSLEGEGWRRASAWLNKAQAPFGGVYLVAAVKSAPGCIGAERSVAQERLAVNAAALANPTRQTVRAASR